MTFDGVQRDFFGTILDLQLADQLSYCPPAVIAAMALVTPRETLMSNRGDRCRPNAGPIATVKVTSFIGISGVHSGLDDDAVFSRAALVLLIQGCHAFDCAAGDVDGDALGGLACVSWIDSCCAVACAAEGRRFCRRTVEVRSCSAANCMSEQGAFRCWSGFINLSDSNLTSCNASWNATRARASGIEQTRCGLLGVSCVALGRCRRVQRRWRAGGQGSRFLFGEFRVLRRQGESTYDPDDDRRL